MDDLPDLSQDFNQAPTYCQNDVLVPYNQATGNGQQSLTYTYSQSQQTWYTQRSVLVGSQMSGTPDSGIQSIGGSPPSIVALTPENVVVQCKQPTANHRKKNDFSDMPTLIPANLQTIEEDSYEAEMPKLPPKTESPPKLKKNTSAALSAAKKTRKDSETLKQCSNLMQPATVLSTKDEELAVGKQVTSKHIMEEFRRLKRKKMAEIYENMIPIMSADLCSANFEIIRPCVRANAGGLLDKIDFQFLEQNKAIKKARFAEFLKSLRPIKNEMPTLKRTRPTGGKTAKEPKGKKMKKEAMPVLKEAVSIQKLVSPVEKVISLDNVSKDAVSFKKETISVPKSPASSKSLSSKTNKPVATKPSHGKSASGKSSKPIASRTGKPGKVAKECGTNSKFNSDTYTKIRSNIVINKPPLLPTPEECECDADIPCTSGRTCPTRYKLMECTSLSCPLYFECKNRCIQKNQQVHQLQHYKTEKKGMGLRTHVDIPLDQYVLEFTGEIITKDIYYNRKVKGYAMHFQDNFVVDGGVKGSLARFMNHSCDANCKIERWNVNGQIRLAIFAVKNISSGDELTVNYSKLWINDGSNEECFCGSGVCQKIIPGQVDRILKSTVVRADLKKKEISIVRNTNIFLVRNVRKNQFLKKPEVELHIVRVDKKLNKIFKSLMNVIKEKENIKTKYINSITLSVNKLIAKPGENNMSEHFNNSMIFVLNQVLGKVICDKKMESILGHYSNIKKSLKFNSNVNSLPTFLSLKKEKNGYSTDVNLSYMDSEIPVCSYNPDAVTMKSEGPDSDCVRCVCGIVEDEGEMVQCDSCYFWLHVDCLTEAEQNRKSDTFECSYCKNDLTTTPAVEVILSPQPEIKLENCIYYKTLVNSKGLQLRINGTVYVKNDLIVEKCTNKQETKSYNRVELRPFRVERLYIDKDGKKFVYGYYYARPHETFCDSSRLFFKNELLRTPLYVSLDLDTAVGRCLVIDLETYCLGRPKIPTYHEDDIFISEFQIDDQQRKFEKIPKDEAYIINTSAYAFTPFKTKSNIRRNFSPFVAVKPNKISPGDDKSTSSNFETTFKNDYEKRLKEVKMKCIERVTKKMA
uniref:AWS domain-containing protein n=1 Tax=Rhabditophanes sp. KR3021 TaxID=114890 RepID=A0AC35U2V9_9BILA